MPPPTLNPQGSRAGLITAVVVLSILFVTSAIFAFYFSAENNKTAKTLDDNRKLLNQYASADAQADAGVQALLELRNDQKYQGMSGIQIAMEQNKALTQANGTLGANVADLTTKLKSSEAENQEKTKQLDEASEKLKEEIAQREKLQAEVNAKLEEQGKQLADAMAQLEGKRTESDQSVGKIQGEASRALQAAQKDTSKLQKELTDREAEIAKLRQELDITKGRLPHPPKTGEPVIREADGKIIRVPGNDNVFINLGNGDHITPGMTFEVYDRFGGVPGLGEEVDTNAVADEKNLPKGRAAIEVVRLGPGQSECRIIRQNKGQPVIEGDIIANLVYDKNTKYSFVVFGDFDLDQNGTPTPGDTEVVKRLITQWGGRLQNDVNVNTDFLVLGAEPEVPAPEENENASDISRREALQKAYEAYQDVVSKAKDLNIPILNQNRFLYYVGYYEQAQR
jgi:hypothetical protein